MSRIAISLLIACVWMLAGCGEIEFLPQGPAQDGTDEKAPSIIVEASLEGNDDVWSIGDSITVAFVGDETHYANFVIPDNDAISGNGKMAIFKGKAPKGSYTAINAIYPGAEDNSGTILLDRMEDAGSFMTAGRLSDINIEDSLSISLSFAHLLHTIEYHITTADGYDTPDPENDKITIKMTASEGNEAIMFWERATYHIESDSLIMLSECDTIIMEVGGSVPSICSTKLFPIDKKDITLHLDLYVNDTDKYHFSKGLKEDDDIISRGGHTIFNLELSESTLVAGPEPAKPIEIRASAEYLKADGADVVTFNVFQEGRDITEESAIFVNGNILDGYEFRTTKPGSYTIYAVFDEVKSNELTITATAVMEGKTIVFADGVSREAGWYDVNKVGQGDVNGDINMCWAASASNMIQWFQDRYVAMGNTLPATAVSGPDPDGIYELALMKMYHDEWDNSLGGHVEQAISWYFEGTLLGGEYASAGSQAVPKTEGGYWKSIWNDEVYPYLYQGYECIIVPEVIEYHNTYTTCFNNYYIWGNGTGFMGTERLKIFSELVVDCFRHGMASMTISLNPNFISLSHASTLWGYEIDNATGLLTRVWITDSDDLTTEPKDKKLNEYSVSIGEGQSNIKLTGDTRYGAIYIQSICPLSGYRIY